MSVKQEVIARLDAGDIEVLLREHPCVYHLLWKGEVVYVGQTKNLRVRIRAHLKDKLFDAVDYSFAFPPETLNDTETRHILELQPHYNRSLPMPNAYCFASGKKLDRDHAFKHKTRAIWYYEHE